MAQKNKRDCCDGAILLIGMMIASVALYVLTKPAVKQPISAPKPLPPIIIPVPEPIPIPPVPKPPVEITDEMELEDEYGYVQGIVTDD